MKLNKLDILYSEFIRKRAIKLVSGCERCRTPKFNKSKEDGSIYPAYKQLQTSHFWGRAKRSVRWDEDNSVGLCGACHLYLTSRPKEHSRWFEEHLGQPVFDLLEARAHIPTKVDEKAIEIYLIERLRNLTEAP